MCHEGYSIFWEFGWAPIENSSFSEKISEILSLSLSRLILELIVFYVIFHDFIWKYRISEWEFCLSTLLFFNQITEVNNKISQVVRVVMKFVNCNTRCFWHFLVEMEVTFALTIWLKMIITWISLLFNRWTINKVSKMWLI